jgi:hypothetical protein
MTYLKRTKPERTKAFLSLFALFKAYNLIISGDKTRNKNLNYLGQMGKQLILV